MSAAEWLVEQVTASPGQVSVLALGPLTNIALALQLNERVTRDLVRRRGPGSRPACSPHSLGASLRPVPARDSRPWAQAELVILGGAFFVNGNVNPAGAGSPP